MHNFIAGRPHGILKICIDSDCRNTRGAPSCGSVFEGWARRRHDVSRAAWAWYRRVRYRVATGSRPGLLLAPLVAQARAELRHTNRSSYSSLHLRTEGDMRRWAGMIKNAFLQETDVVQWMKKIT